ncbi:glycine betaine ABC transporter substrate-binding protein [Oceanobacillus oncorhynchi subsp. oncorhynchi]|uniref:glycine betaine ABC transporter substrate-binding protein n=1 Tax=Oceanobacillus TaxID=182709 RepID=UPI0030D995E2
MSKWSLKRAGLIGSLALGLVVAGCGSDDSSDNGDGDGGDGSRGDLEIAYVEWDSEVASTHVIAQVLEDEGYDVTLTALDNAVMWEAVANGEADGMVSAWLPLTHEGQYEAYADQVVELGPNLEGAKIGLVVPEYMDVDSIEDLSDEAGQNITGIEPGAGVVNAAENAVEEYDNLEDWTVQTSSSGAMATELGSAYDSEDEIVVTGWTPHWKFQAYDLKYLEDPDGVFGEAETIDTMVREGLEEDSPEAYQILDNFYWTPEDMEEVMLDINEGASPEDAAADWVEANQDKVDEWTEGIE